MIHDILTTQEINKYIHVLVKLLVIRRFQHKLDVLKVRVINNIDPYFNISFYKALQVSYLKGNIFD
jgi:hypothetical protein